MHLHLYHRVATAVEPSPHVREVAAMFGLGLDAGPARALIPPTDLELGAGELVLITGPSGSGKSTLLRLMGEQIHAAQRGAGGGASGSRAAARGGLIRFEGLGEAADVPLVDQFPGRPLKRVLGLLSRAGLNDAFVMLRRPAELSDGQRYRFDLARCFARAEEAQGAREAAAAEGAGGVGFTAVLADEFGATLDRVTARAIAAHVRKWVRGWGVCMVVATTHDDLLEPLCPDVLIEKPLGEALRVYRR